MTKKIYKAVITYACILIVVFSAVGIVPLPAISDISFVHAAEAAIINLETVITMLAAIGGSGAVVVIVAATTGLTGAAALVTALSLMGGPLGILGGVFATAGVSLLCYSISQYGVGYILERLAQKWKADGKSVAEIEAEIDNISGLVVSDTTKEAAKRAVKRYM